MGAILAAAASLVAVSALIVPTITAQAAWTWHRASPDAEAAVLARLTPGPRRIILAARAVVVTAWLLSITGAGITSGLLVGEATQRLQAIAIAYSKDDAADSLRSDLLDRYVVGDIHCPDSLPDSGRDDTFTCTVTSLGRTVSVEARWSANGFGSGGVNAANPDHARLVQIADLPGAVPEAVALDHDASAAEVVGSVRSQMIAEGWSRSSRAVTALRYPSIGGGAGDDADFVRCTTGRDPETQRYLDVYPVAQHRFVARTAEIADLPRSV